MKHTITYISFVCTILLVIAFFSACTKEVNGEEIDYVLASGDMVTKYSGQLVGGKPEGTCIATIQSGSSSWEYHGTIENATLVNLGSVTSMPYLLHSTGGDYSGLYTGDVWNGEPDGHGNFRYSDGDSFLTYDGTWEAGKMHGEGQLNSNVHVVHFTDGLDRKGFYEGDVVDGIPCGNGKFSATNSEGVHYQYDGEWKSGLYNGQGRLIFDSDAYYDRIGTFTDADFTPTFIELFVSLGTREPKFDLSEKQIEMLNFFNDNDKGDQWEEGEFASFLSEHTYDSLKNAQYVKNPSNYQEKLIFWKNSRIVQINEYDNLLGYDATSFRMILTNQDGTEVVYAYGIGETPEMFEGTNIHVWGYPLGASSYESDSKQTISCVVAYIFAIAYADR